MKRKREEKERSFLKVGGISIFVDAISSLNEGRKYIVSFFEECRFLTALDYVWIEDNQFCPERRYLEALAKDRKGLLRKFGLEYDCTNIENFYPLLDDRGIIYLDRENKRVIGISDEGYYSNLLKRVLSLGYLKASYEASFFCLLLHSAGIVVDEHCFIFPALSGMGKTTISLRAKEHGLSVLSDEYVVVTKRDDVFVVHPTPFGEIGNETRSYPLSGIIMLCKDQKNQIRAFPWIEGFLRTWNGEFYYRFYYTHGNYAEKLFSQLMDLYKNVPCFYLNFKEDFNEWHLLLNAVSGAPLEVFSIFELKKSVTLRKKADGSSKRLHPNL